MYPILAQDSSAGPGAAGARRRTRLLWQFYDRRSAGRRDYPEGIPRGRGPVDRGCLLTVKGPLSQTRRVSSTGCDGRSGSFHALGASSRASPARTQANFRLRQRLARKP